MASEKPLEYHIEKIKDLHEIKKQYPDLETIDKKLYIQLSAFEYKLEKTFYVSGQEKYPWTSAELGHETKDMLTLVEMNQYFSKRWLSEHKDKLDLFRGYEKEDVQPQCGDYQCYIIINGRVIWIPIVVERKGGHEGKSGAEDIYSSLSCKDNRQNIYEEIDRMNKDKRFLYKYLIAECSFKDFMEFSPRFNGKVRNVNHISLSAETKRATVAGIEIRGCHVIWAGTRNRSIQMYKDLIRQWIMKNYSDILLLNEMPYDDKKFLLRKEAMLLEELKAVRASLGVLQ